MWIVSVTSGQNWLLNPGFKWQAMTSYDKNHVKLRNPCYFLSKKSLLNRWLCWLKLCYPGTPCIGLQWWEFLQRSKDSQNLISGSSDLRSWVHIDSYKSFSLKILANFHSNTLWVPWANSTRVEKKHLVLFSSWNRLLHLLKMLRALYLCYDFFNISKNNFSN